jgi:type IV secretion system protein TrbC
MQKWEQWVVLLAWLASVGGWQIGVALAGTGGGGTMPWDPLLDALVVNIGGRTLRIILILAIIFAGVGFYFASSGTWIQTAFALIIGFSIAAAAATWGPTFFGLAAAAPVRPSPLPPLTGWDALPLAGRLLTWWAIVQAVLWRLGDSWRWWQTRHGRA